MDAPMLKAKIAAIIEQGEALCLKGVASEPGQSAAKKFNMNHVIYVLSNVMSDKYWRLDENEFPSNVNSNIQQIIYGSSGRKSDSIPDTQTERFAVALQLYITNFGGRAVSRADAKALWAGNLATFKDALKPVSPFRSLLCAPHSRYVAQPSWDYEAYERQAHTVPGEDEAPEDISYHPDVKFVHRLEFSTPAPKCVVVMAGVLGFEEPEKGIWNLLKYTGTSPAKFNVPLRLKWPVSDPEEFPGIRTMKSRPNMDILHDDTADDWLIAVRDSQVREGYMVYLALGWYMTSRHCPKQDEIDRWAVQRTEGMHSTTADEIARKFLSAQANRQAEMSRCDIRFATNGRRERPS